MDVARYQPLRGGSYLPLPAAVRNKKTRINPKNMDADDCLEWTFLIAEADPQPPHHPERISWYAVKKGKYSSPEINTPTPVSQIPKFEKLFNKAINVFGWDGGVKFHHICNQPPNIRRHNVLQIERDGKFHYTLIEHLNRLLYGQNKHRRRKYFCERGLHGYTREDLLESHKLDCRGIGQTAVRVDMQKEGKNKVAFQNNLKRLLVPFIIYADFQALTTKVEGPELDPAKSNTKQTQHHETCSYCYIVVRCDGQMEPPVEYRCPDAAGHLLKSLQEEESKIKGVLADPKAMRMTREDDWPSAQLRHATYVTNLSRATLCVTTATLQVNIEGQLITPATSSYG